MSIRNHREISYDRAAKIRKGQCLVETRTQTITVTYTVKPSDQPNETFVVAVEPFGDEPPACNSREVVSMVDDIVRKDSPSVVSIGDHREISYDQASKSRKGQCLVKTKTETLTITYTIKTVNPENGTFVVEVEPFFPPDPPECNDPAVIAQVERALRRLPSGHFLITVTGHEEIRYDRDEKVRHGRCLATMRGWSVPFAYKVYWVDQKTGSFRVELEQ